MKTIDHYSYWNTKRKERTYRYVDRERIAARLLSPLLCANTQILDAGCGNGLFIQLMRKLQPDAVYHGIDYSHEEVKEARKKGLSVKQGNFDEQGISFPAHSFDVAYTGEVIEHLYNPDHYLQELNRILKKNGHLVLSTPNLGAWFNRIFMLFGIQPLFLEPSTQSKLIGAGPLKRFKDGSQPVGHVRIFGYDAITDLLRLNGFKIVTMRGTLYDEGLPKILWPVDRFFSYFPRLTSNWVIVARKVSSPRPY